MNYLNNSILFTFLLVIMGCSKTDQQELQKKYLEDKIEDYKAYRWRSCQQEILQKAEAKSDSFFIAKAKQQTFDSTEVPTAIRRPEKPEVKIREDTLPLRPLLQKKEKVKKDTSSVDSMINKD